MIHYHGGPIWPVSAAASFWATRHGCVSFANPEQMSLVGEVCQSFILDNGAYTSWTQGVPFDFDGYCEWVETWGRHPGCDFVLMPDAIDGGMDANRAMRARWVARGMHRGPWQSVPVWHMDEPLEELQYLCVAYTKIALGSAGEFAVIGDDKWWHRMHEIMGVVCDEMGRPKVKLHGLRMLSPTVFSHLPLASADSTNVARSIVYDKAWKGPYQPVSEYARAVVLADRVERHVA